MAQVHNRLVYNYALYNMSTNERNSVEYVLAKYGKMSLNCLGALSQTITVTKDVDFLQKCKCE